jgi:hypothetical protein
MKNLLTNMMTVSLLISGQTVFAQGKPQMSATKKAMFDELAKPQTMSNGMKVLRASPESVDKALKAVNNKATVDLGGGKVFKIDEAPGRVVVGSGADGLVANTNATANSPLVVPIPITPKMSITVAGMPSYANYYSGPTPIKSCALFVPTDDNGQLIMGAFRRDKFGYDSSCVTVGSPIRLKKAGYYFLTISDQQVVSSMPQMLIKIDQDENKIVPIRKIVVPAVKTDSSISFRLIQDLKSSDYDLRQYANYLFEGYNNDNFINLVGEKTAQEIQTPEDVFNLLDASDDDTTIICAKNEAWKRAGEKCPGDYVYKIEEIPHDIYYANSLDANAYLHNDQVKDQVFYVLPGVYEIMWRIDTNAPEFTKGLYVQ